MRRFFATTATVALTLCQFAGGNLVVACDKPIAQATVVRPVEQRVHSILVVTETITVQPSLIRLDKLQLPVSEYVDHCRSEQVAANRGLESAEIALTDVESDIQLGIQKMSVLRDLLNQPGCSICIGNKSFSKEEIASVLSLELDKHVARDVVRVNRIAAVSSARKIQQETLERVQKWEAKQKELVSRVNAIRVQSLARDKAAQDAKQAAAAKAAIAEASQLAETLEAQLKASTAELPPPASPSDLVSSAAAEFDRHFVPGVSVAVQP